MGRRGERVCRLRQSRTFLHSPAHVKITGLILVMTGLSEGLGNATSTSRTGNNHTTVSPSGSVLQTAETPLPIGFTSPTDTTVLPYTSVFNKSNEDGSGADMVLILGIGGGCFALLLLMLVGFVVYQRASLGKMRRRRKSRHLDLSSLSAGKPLYDKKLSFELSSSSLATDYRRSSRRRSKQEMADPVLLSTSGAIGFDGDQMRRSMGGKFPRSFSDMALGSDLQSARARMHAKNSAYSPGLEESDETDGFDDLVSTLILGKNRPKKMVPVTRSTPSSLRYTRSTSVIRNGKLDKEEGMLMEETPKRLVRHFSWYASGNQGFSAALQSGEEVTSPFALMVSQRMVEHRSGANSPLSACEPLEEEELEDMLASDPEMGTELTDVLIETSADESTGNKEWDSKFFNADWLP